MSKATIYTAAAAVLGFLYWHKAHTASQAQKTINEGFSFANASDWQGNMWTRLSGGDLTVQAKNIGGTAVADPGKIGTASTGLVPGWNGGLA
jgi:hypothetical protein